MGTQTIPTILRSVALFSFACLLTGCDAQDRTFVTEFDCERDSSAKIKPPGKFYSDVDATVLQSLEYPAEIVRDDVEGRSAEKYNLMPQVALKISEGWLVGSSRGEHGGEAVFVGGSSGPKIVIKDNVEDIYQMPFGYVVTAGLAHMTYNQGAIYVVTFDAALSPKAEIIFALSSIPISSWKLSDGRLLINMSGSSVVLDLNGNNLRRVRCIGMEYHATSEL